MLQFTRMCRNGKDTSITINVVHWIEYTFLLFKGVDGGVADTGFFLYRGHRVPLISEKKTHGRDFLIF